MKYNELELRILRAREVNVGGECRRPVRFFAVAWMEPDDLLQTSARRPQITVWNETVVHWNHDDVLFFEDDVLEASCLNLQVVGTGGVMPDPTTSTREYVVGNARLKLPTAASGNFFKGSVPVSRRGESSCKVELEMRLRKRAYP